MARKNEGLSGLSVNRFVHLVFSLWVCFIPGDVLENLSPAVRQVGPKGNYRVGQSG